MIQRLVKIYDTFRLAAAALYLRDRFFRGLGLLICLAVAAYTFPFMWVFVVLVLAAGLGALGYDLWQLYQGEPKIVAHRMLPKVLSLGDEMSVKIKLANLSGIPLELRIIDELPEQLQIRDQRISLSLAPLAQQLVRYPVRPSSRGSYFFGDLHVFTATALGLVERRFTFQQAVELPVYPSIIQMQQFDKMAFSVTVPAPGMRKLRRQSKSYEFDQIKNYVRGDDYRAINWRATSRQNELMINQYEDERSQQIYCVIDKSRHMHMPFKGLSLLDYAINATLALSNVILKKHDKAGLITYSDKIGSILPADSKSVQLEKILKTLYREEAREGESDPDLLYFASRKFISGRSLFLLFSNFESNYALDRALPVLRRIHASHLLVVVLFENTELEDYLSQDAHTLEAVYQQSTARQFRYEKRMLAQRLRQLGIQVILTRPEDLSAATIDRYLALKSRGLI